MLNAMAEIYSTVWKGMKENQECTNGDYWGLTGGAFSICPKLLTKLFTLFNFKIRLLEARVENNF